MLLVIVDWLTKSFHFLVVNMMMYVIKFAQLYIKKIVRLHEVSSSIVSDKDLGLISKFWQTLQSSLGSRLMMS